MFSGQVILTILNMTLKEIRWGHFLGDDPPLPPDVTFKLIEDEVVVGELKAHKYLLASVSPVFRKQFFGKLAEEKNVIDIKETTYYAFKYLMGYIYNGLSDVNEDEIGLEEIFEIVNLAEKYDIKTLRDDIPRLLGDIFIEESNVLDVSRIALVFKHFDVISNQLLSKCSEYLKLILKTDEDLENFCSSFVHYPEDQQIVLDLLRRGETDENNIILQSPSDELDKVDVTPPCLLKMCLKNVNWLEFLTPDSEIPPDITFRIIELPKSGIMQDSESESKVVGEIKAHKYYLSTISEVFKEQFFNGVAEYAKHKDANHNEVVEIVGPSFNAFKVMIDYIYGKYPTLRGAEEICEIFEIINLQERFKIWGLEEEYRTALFLYFREGHE